MPPSLRVRVGVPLVVLIVTASLMATVNVTVLPTPRSPLPLVMPLPEVVNDDTVGVVVSICGPLWVRPESDRLAALPAPSAMVAELRLTAVAASADAFCPAPTV